MEEELVEGVQPQIKKKVKQTEEERKRKAVELTRRWRKKNKDNPAIKQQNKKANAEYYKKNREEILQKSKNYRQENKVKVNEKDKKYYKNNIGIIKEKRNRPEEKEKQKAWKKENYKKNKEKILIKSKEYNEAHKKERSEQQKNYHISQKIKAFDLLGGCKCLICANTNIKHLTIDHIDSSGSCDRKNKLGTQSLQRAIINKKLTKEQLNNLRVLCWNHNCSRQREYLGLPHEKQTHSQKYRTELWNGAFNFFGPCACGHDNLKFLTISHIHNDGAERRKMGEQKGAALLAQFRQQGWPESLKEDFCLECYNCNCG